MPLTPQPPHIRGSGRRGAQTVRPSPPAPIVVAIVAVGLCFAWLSKEWGRRVGAQPTHHGLKFDDDALRLILEQHVTLAIEANVRLSDLRVLGIQWEPADDVIEVLPVLLSAVRPRDFGH